MPVLVRNAWVIVDETAIIERGSAGLRKAPPLLRRWPMKAWMSGNVAGTGTFRCTECDYPVSLDVADELPDCPNCGGREFVRSSLFTTSQTAIVEMVPDLEDQGWLDELRRGVEEPGQYL